MIVSVNPVGGIIYTKGPMSTTCGVHPNQLYCSARCAGLRWVVSERSWQGTDGTDDARGKDTDMI